MKERRSVHARVFSKYAWASCIRVRITERVIPSGYLEFPSSISAVRLVAVTLRANLLLPFAAYRSVFLIFLFGISRANSVPFSLIIYFLLLFVAWRGKCNSL